MQNRQSRSVRSLTFFALFVVASYLGSRARLPVLVGLDFQLVSIFTLVGLRCFPPSWGIALAAIASSLAALFSGHPWFGVGIATTEAAFVLWHLRRSWSNLILADGLYWLLLGMPALGLFSWGFLQTSPNAALAFALARGCNGIFNAAIASLLAQFLLLAPSQGSADPRQGSKSNWTPTLQQRTFSVLFACVCFPTLAVAALDSWQSMRMLEVRAQTQLTAAGTALSRDADAWFAERQNAIAELAHRLPAGEADPYLARTAPLFEAIYAVDATDTVATIAPTPERAPTPAAEAICPARAPEIVPVKDRRTAIFINPMSVGGRVCGRVVLAELTQYLQHQGAMWKVEVELLARDRPTSTVEATVRTDASRRQPDTPIASAQTFALGEGLPWQLRVRPLATVGGTTETVLSEAGYGRRLAAMLSIWSLASAAIARLSQLLATPLQRFLQPSPEEKIVPPNLRFERSSDSQLHALAAALPACLAYLDREGCYRFASEAHQTCFDLDPATLEGRHLQDVLDDRIAAIYLPYLARALRGEPVQFEVQVGDRRLGIVLTPDRDASGAIRGCYAFHTDSEKGDAPHPASNHGLENGNAPPNAPDGFLQTAIDTLPVAICVKAISPQNNGEYLLWNPACERLFGIPADRALGRTDRQLFPEAQVAAIARGEEEAISRQHPVETVCAVGDDATRSIHVVSVPLCDRANRPQYLLSYIQDITARVRAEAAQRERERRWGSLLDATTDALLVVDDSGRIRFNNPAAERLFGRSTVELADYGFGRMLPTATKEFTEIEILQPAGNVVFAQMRVVEIDWEGEPAYLASLTDVTERHAAEDALRRREANYRGLVDNLDAGVAVFAPDASITLCNAKVCKLFGLPAADLLGKRLDELTQHWCREDGTALFPDEYPVSQVLQQRVPLRQVVFGICPEEGDRTWVLVNAFPEFDRERQLLQVVVTFADISNIKHAETRLRHAALHDSLTGLPNRALLAERLDRALKHARRHPDYWFAVLFIDLDRFKTINDSLGHQVGDLLLLEVARRLEAMVRANDTVCRLGGDEFVVLLDGICDAREASHVAERIQESLQALQQLDGCEIATSASIGIALSQIAYTHSDEILRDADTAMYRAKTRGRACYEIFDRAMHEQVLERFQLETSLRRALEREEFSVCYQPIVCLPDRRVLGFEALVRWKHPELGNLPPSKFIPIAEETGSIVPLGAWVLETACRCLRDWRDRLPEVAASLEVGVNVSARQFQEGDFLQTIDRVLQETGLPPQCLNLEVTEGSLLQDVDRTIDTLLALRERRVSVSIDDFGTGYSSLSYLKRFPIDTLKIDRSFVSGLGTLPEDERIVEAIVTLAGTFGLQVIAEGVETELQLDRIEAMGCGAVQGNWFSPPLNVGDAEQLAISYNQPSSEPR